MRNSSRIFRTSGKRKPGRCLTVALIVASAGSLLAACGGGSGGGSSATTTTISGSVFAAPVSGASVTVKNAGGATVAGPVTTAADGTYSVAIPGGALSGILRFESAGGTFTDEATGSNTTAGRLAACVEANTLGAGSAIHLTPASTIVHDLVVAGGTVAAAKAAFNATFGFTPDTGIAPKNDSAVGTDDAQKLAALRAAAFSQMTEDKTLTPDRQFDVIADIGRDLADGTLDGMNGAVPAPLSGEDVPNRFGCALATFLADAGRNHTGLTPDKIGAPPFGKVAFTSTYRVEYVPGMMPAVQGMTRFKVKVTNRISGVNVPGLSLTLMPMMHMPSMVHSTPVDGPIVDNGDGTYSCTVYYLMSSSMGGMSMGYWELKVATGGMMGETATFHPAVGMAMGGDTVRATLKGQNDNIAGMMGGMPEQRTYYLFRDGTVTGSSGNHTLGLFLAAKESMMNYPAISAGTTLHDPSNAPWTASSVTLQASTDNAAWVTATNGAGGHWSLSGIAGLTTGSAGPLYVRLFVNAEQKTTDGLTPAGANVSATFTVTP